MTPGLVLTTALTLILPVSGSSLLRRPGHSFSAPDTLLVEIVLVETGERRVVEALLESDSTLALLTSDVAAFTGAKLPPVPWVTTRDLEHAFGGTTWTFDPRALTVYVRDPMHVLPVVRDFVAAAMRVAQGAPPYAYTQSGPFLAAAVANDAAGSRRLEAGYSWRGKVSAEVVNTLAGGNTWAVAFTPAPALFVTYAGGQHEPGAVSARLAKGPVWVAPAWDGAARRFQADALVAFGGVSVYASTRALWLFTVKTGRGGDLQVGRSAGVTAARVSFGPVPASPFNFPTTR